MSSLAEKMHEAMSRTSAPKIKDVSKFVGKEINCTLPKKLLHLCDLANELAAEYSQLNQADSPICYLENDSSLKLKKRKSQIGVEKAIVAELCTNSIWCFLKTESTKYFEDKSDPYFQGCGSS